MPNKVICDPVYRHIYFDPEEEKIVLALLNCKEVQRLRRIRQLGVGFMTYPGAEHSRFSHALGTSYLMNVALNYIRKNQDENISRQIRLAALSAALLHDIGHGPFSHLLENSFEKKHEKWTEEIICDPQSDVNKVLIKKGKYFPELVKGIINGQENKYSWISALLSGQLDVDRIDYLHRDSHYCGIMYGVFDYDWIFHNMKLCEENNFKQPVWKEKAKRAIEEYIFARLYMYLHVYYHKTTRGYEELLKTIILRAKEISKRKEKKISLTKEMTKFLRTKDLSYEEYLNITDDTILAHIAYWTKNKDKILADLSRRFLNRDGLKPVEVPDQISTGNLEKSAAINKIEELLIDRKFDPKYYFLENVTVAQAYDFYHGERNSEERTAKTSILIETKKGIQEISTVEGMLTIKVITGETYKKDYYYVPEETRKEVEKILKEKPGS